MRTTRLLSLVLACLAAACAQAFEPRPVPEFTSTRPEQWVNSPPLTTAKLRGQVLLIDVWTFDCWNCYRSFPWLKGLEARLANQPFRVIGVHSPEFEHERELARVAAKVREFGLEHPVMLDNDFAFWRALGNRYWPAFYLVDKEGLIRHLHVGETHAGTARARLIEEQLDSLLSE